MVCFATRNLITRFSGALGVILHGVDACYFLPQATCHVTIYRQPLNYHQGHLEQWAQRVAGGGVLRSREPHAIVSNF